MFDKKFVEELPRPQGLPCQNTKKFNQTDASFNRSQRT